MEHFKTINTDQLYRLLKRFAKEEMAEPDNGKFLLPEADGTFTAIDNTTWNMYMENFKTRFEAVKYLVGEGKE